MKITISKGSLFHRVFKGIIDQAIAEKVNPHEFKKIDIEYAYDWPYTFSKLAVYLISLYAIFLY